MAYKKRRPWDSQPQEAVEIDPQWFDKGLVALFDATGKNLVDDAITLTAVGTFSRKVTTQGVGLDNAGSAYFNASGNLYYLIAPNRTNFTVVGQVAANALGLTNRYLAHVRLGGTPQTAILFGYVANSFEFYANGYSGDDPRTGTQMSVTDTNPHTFCYAYDGSTWSGALDGTQKFSTARTFTLGNGPSSSHFLSAVSGSNVANHTALLWGVFNRGIPKAEQLLLTENPNRFFRDRTIWIPVSAGGTAALTGTATTATETDIVTGGRTIILTLTGDTWVAAGGTFDAQRQNIINGIDSDLSEATGWDAVVKANQGVSGVVRTSDTVVTITLDAQAAYDITATETITATIPASALTAASPIVASPAFQVTAASGFQAAWARGSNTVLQVGL